jgi:anti-anti-sigma factor
MSDLVEVVADVDRDVPVCHVRGEIDASNIELVQARLTSSIVTNAHGLVIDLTDTDYLDSAGVRVLFYLASELRARGQSLQLVSPPNGIVRRVLALTAFDDIVPVHGQIEQAIEALR